MEETSTTPFSDVYESFLSKVTDDMYMELTKKQTYDMLEDLLISSIPKFEFPRKNLFDYEKGFSSVISLGCMPAGFCPAVCPGLPSALQYPRRQARSRRSGHRDSAEQLGRGLPGRHRHAQGKMEIL